MSHVLDEEEFDASACLRGDLGNIKEYPPSKDAAQQTQCARLEKIVADPALSGDFKVFLGRDLTASCWTFIRALEAFRKFKGAEHATGIEVAQKRKKIGYAIYKCFLQNGASMHVSVSKDNKRDVELALWGTPQHHDVGNKLFCVIQEELILRLESVLSGDSKSILEEFEASRKPCRSAAAAAVVPAPHLSQLLENNQIRQMFLACVATPSLYSQSQDKRKFAKDMTNLWMAVRNFEREGSQRLKNERLRGIYEAYLSDGLIRNFFMGISSDTVLEFDRHAAGDAVHESWSACARSMSILQRGSYIFLNAECMKPFRASRFYGKALHLLTRVPVHTIARALKRADSPTSRGIQGPSSSCGMYVTGGVSRSAFASRSTTFDGRRPKFQSGKKNHSDSEALPFPLQAVSPPKRHSSFFGSRNKIAVDTSPPSPGHKTAAPSSSERLVREAVSLYARSGDVPIDCDGSRPYTFNAVPSGDIALGIRGVLGDEALSNEFGAYLKKRVGLDGAEQVLLFALSAGRFRQMSGRSLSLRAANQIAKSFFAFRAKDPASSSKLENFLPLSVVSDISCIYAEHAKRGTGISKTMFETADACCRNILLGALFPRYESFCVLRELLPELHGRVLAD